MTAQCKHIRHSSVPAMYPHTTIHEIHLAPAVIDYQEVSSQDGCRSAQFGATWTRNVPWRGLEWRFGCQVNFTKTRCVSIKPGPSKPNQVKPSQTKPSQVKPGQADGIGMTLKVRMIIIWANLPTLCLCIRQLFCESCLLIWKVLYICLCNRSNYVQT